MNVTKYMPFSIVLALCVSEMCIMIIIQDFLCDVVEKFQHFVQIKKSDLHVYNVKMTMLPVLNYHEILLKSRRYIWQVFMQI